MSLAVLAMAGAVVVAFTVVGDGVPMPLTSLPGDAARGETIVKQRQAGLCVLCHAVPAGVPALQGNLSTALEGAGSRWSEAQLRLRIVDSKRLNPQSVMPAFHRIDGLHSVGSAWRGKPILDSQQVEDVVAYLKTLK